MKRAFVFLLLPAFTSFILLGCDSTGVSPDSSSDADQARTSKVEDFTGKDLYRGLLFGHGEVASLFPEVYDNPEVLSDRTLEAADQQIESMDREEIRRTYEEVKATSPEEYRRAVHSLADSLMGHIQENSPGFFRRFERRMKSGEPLKVQKALVSMSEVTFPAMAATLKVPEETLREGNFSDIGSGQGKCLAINAVAIVNVALNVNAAVNGNVAANLNAAVNLNAAINVNVAVVQNTYVGATTGDSGLEQEMMVRRIADRLAV